MAKPNIGLLIGMKPKAEEGDTAPSEGFGDELIAAIKAGDGAAVEACLRDAWAEWDEEPHTEGPHTPEEGDESEDEGEGY
jgi:hypothetical protein